MVGGLRRAYFSSPRYASPMRQVYCPRLALYLSSQSRHLMITVSTLQNNSSVMVALDAVFLDVHNIQRVQQ